MIKKIKTFKLIPLLLSAFFICSQLVFAAGSTIGNQVNLTPPEGKDILPNPPILNAPSIQESYIFSNLIPFVIRYAIDLAAALSVIAIIIGGYQYVTAYGNEDKHKKAQNTIIYALIGLVLAITAFGLVRILTSIQIK